MSGVIEVTKRLGMATLGTIAFALGSGSLIFSSGKIWAKLHQTTPAIGTVISLKKLETHQHDLSVAERNCPVIRFRAKNGKTVDHFEELFCNSSTVGKQVRVVYNAKNPKSVSIANGMRLIAIIGWSATAFIGLCLGVFGIGALWNGLLGSLSVETDEY